MKQPNTDFKDWMDARRLKASDVCDQLHVSFQTITNWRSIGVPSRRLPHIQTFMKNWVEPALTKPLPAVEDKKCNTEDAVVTMIRNRGKVGRDKYRTSMDRKDLHPDEWINHFQEELADALQYAERMKGATKLLHEAYSIMSLLHENGREVAEDWVNRYHEQFLPPNAIGEAFPPKPRRIYDTKSNTRITKNGH